MISADDFDGTDISSFDGVAFGCPAMGDEVLEDTEFEPMFDGCKDALKGRTSLCLVLMDGETANGCVTGRVL